MSPKTCVLQTWPRLSSVFKQPCVFLGGCFIPLLCMQPTLAARRADDLHVHRGESEKPPNGVFHSGTTGDIFMSGRVRRLLLPLSVRSLKVWCPWRSREGWRRLSRQENARKAVRANLVKEGKQHVKPRSTLAIMQSEILDCDDSVTRGHFCVLWRTRP